jgi:hypothetical protein
MDWNVWATALARREKIAWTLDGTLDGVLGEVFRGAARAAQVREARRGIEQKRESRRPATPGDGATAVMVREPE